MSSADKSPAFSEMRKGEVSELRVLLGNVQVRRNQSKLEEVIKKVIAYMTLGIDVSRLFSEMVMACQSGEIRIKKMVYLFLTHYAQANADLAILAINTLRKDCSDADPMVRGLALRSLTNLHLRSMLEYVMDPLTKGLEDHSSYVRKAAVLGVLKVHLLDRSSFDDCSYINTLYNMLRDPDSHVVMNSIVSLNEIMADEGGIVINNQIISYLLHRINEFDEWGKCSILALVAKYDPMSTEETFSLMNVLDATLSISNSAVVLGACHCFLALSRECGDNILSQVYLRMKDPLLTSISGYVRDENIFAVLKHVSLITGRRSSVFEDAYKQFYCRFNDPSNVKYIKVDILADLANPSNVAEVIAELSEYVADVDTQLATSALSALGKIAIREVNTLGTILSQMLDYIQIDNESLRTGAAIVIKDIIRTHPNCAKEVGPTIASSLPKLCSHTGRSALIWILGHHGSVIREAPYAIEHLILNVENENNSSVLLELLVAATKLFLIRPPEMKKMLGSLLKSLLVADDVDPDLHDRAIYIYRSLRLSVTKMGNTIHFPTHEVSNVSAGNDDVGGTSYNEFNTLSVLYGKAALEFTNTSNILHCRASRGHNNGDGGNELHPYGVSVDGCEDTATWHLVDEANIEKKSFQEIWERLDIVKYLKGHSTSVPTIEHVVSVFSKACLFTVASGRPNGQIKSYMYCTDCKGNIFLIELIIAVDNAITVNIKSTGTENLTKFISIVEDVLLHL